MGREVSQPGEEEAEERGALCLNLGDSLLLVDSDLCRGSEARLGFTAGRLVLICSSEVGDGK